MSSIFRSEKMYLCEIYMPGEAVYSILAALGEQKVVQFRDLNSENVKNRLFVNEVQMCDNLEGKLHYLRLQTKDYNVKLKKRLVNPPAPNPRQLVDLSAPGTADFDLLRKLYNEVKQISYNLSPLERTLKLHLEYQAILKTACSLLFQKVTSLLDIELGLDFNVHIIGGVLGKVKWSGFEKTLWRLCHGNYVLQVSDIRSGDTEERRLFVILVHGTFLKNKILKLCQSFSADMYDIPESRDHCSDLSNKNKSIIADLRKTLATSKEHYVKILSMTAANLCRWLVEIKKMKYIYHTMNKFKLEESETFFVAECWVPKKSFETFQNILYTQSISAGCDVAPMVFIVDHDKEHPPTYFRLNKFTKGFQNIIDAYGIANYKELNPMPFTVITFPFLFSIMFSDVGHGLIMFLIGLFLVLKEKQIQQDASRSEIFRMVFTGRYIILLMGLFSIYSGLIFNEVFSFFINFGTSWKISEEAREAASTQDVVELIPRLSFDNPNVFGLDPIWRLATNEIQVYNSLKMKLSIILGIVHMSFGIWLSLFNMIYFKDYVSIYTEFIPQLVFFGALFGYFIFLIIIKWLTYGSQFASEGRSSYCAPSIIITFVNVVLPSSPVPLEGCDQEMYPYQGDVESAIFYLACICVPWLLLAKPLYYYYKGVPPPEGNQFVKKPKEEDITNRKFLQMRQNHPSQHSNTERNKQTKEQSTEAEVGARKRSAFNKKVFTWRFGPEFVEPIPINITSIIQKTTPNLSLVLEEMVLNSFYSVSTIFPTFIGGLFNVFGFYVWGLLSIAILIIMEGLSAFLHALRLHWMEFQTKFYIGQGYPFTPFSLKSTLSEAMNELE